MKLSFVGARAGGGKSYALIKSAVNRYLQGEKTIIAAPTKILIDELVRDIHDRFPNIRANVLYGNEDSSTSVTTRVLRHLRTSKFGGEVVFVTHPGLLNLPYFPNKERWRVIFDEVPSVYSVTDINLPETHQILTDHLQISKSSSVYGMLTVSNKTAMKRISDNRKEDEFFATLKSTARELLDDNKVTWVKSVDFDKLVRNEKDRTNLTLHTLVKPSVLEGFEKVTIAAAGIEKTLMYHAWKELGVEWTVDEELESHLLRPLHPHNPTVKIFYGYEQANSKNLRNKLISRNDNQLRTRAIEVMNGEPFLWSENQDYVARTSLKECENGEQLPGISHGLNEFQHIHHAAILGAYNYKRDQSDFLDKVYGFDRDMQREAMNLNIYQNVMRGSIRNDNLTDQKNIVVASRVDAHFLHQMLPGSMVRALDIPQLAPSKSGPKRKYATDNERKRASERRKADDKVLRTRFADNLSVDILRDSVMWDKSDESSYTVLDEFVRNFRGSYFTNWKDTSPQLICMDETQWRNQLKEMHNNSFKSKHEINMISCALFNASWNNGSVRQSENVEFARDVWLDFEDGDLSPDQFAAIFPTVEMLAYNSFRHTKRKPRFRVRLVTNRPMLRHEYQSIYHEIRHVLHQNGYTKGFNKSVSKGERKGIKYSGLDYRPEPSLLSGLPCQAQSSKHSFFVEYTSNRKPLDVAIWLRQSSYLDGSTDYIPFPDPSPDNDELSPEQHSAIEIAKGNWTAESAQRGNGDHALFQLWLSLRLAGVSDQRLDQELMKAARNSTSKADRVAQAKRLLRKSRGRSSN